jgi:hypothetical protein
MKLKAKREAVNIAPSEFALRVPSIDKRNDNLLKQGHSVVVPSNILKTYSQTQGAYIKQHTHNNMEHKESNFTPKFLALLKKSSPASEYPADDEPPVEGGAEGEGASVGEKSEGEAKEGESAEGEAKAKSEKSESVGEDFELFAIAPPKKPAGDPLVWKPVGEAYTKLKLPVELQQERQGASMLVNGKSLTDQTEADLPTLKKVVIKMGTLRDRLDGSFHKRVKDDVKKIEKAIKRLEPSYKGERVKTPVSLKVKGGMGLGGAVAVAKELLGAGAGGKAVKELLAKAGIGGGGGAGGGGAGADEEGWEYPKKGRGKK